MPRILFAMLFLSTLIILSCKDEEKKTTNETTVKSAEDSLLDAVNQGHDDVMPKMGKVRAAQKEIQRMIDSIATLPAKAQQGAAELKAKLEKLVNDLDYADFAMDKWMVEFKRDSARQNLEARLNYLATEKLKVDKVKDAVLTGLARADSVLKARF
jgi:hypothetical protein